MKQGIHPEYREVVFQDISCDFSFVTRSTAATRDKITWKDGKEYPLIKLDTSAASHPFYTGAQTRIVEAGRVIAIATPPPAFRNDRSFSRRIIK